MTKKELINKLRPYHEDSNLLFNLNSSNDIKHISNTKDGDIIISCEKPIGNCNSCNEYVFKEHHLDYLAYCPNCDENKYSFEITNN